MISRTFKIGSQMFAVDTGETPFRVYLSVDDEYFLDLEPILRSLGFHEGQIDSALQRVRRLTPVLLVSGEDGAEVRLIDQKG